MKKKKHSKKPQGSGGFEHLATNSDFYTGAPTERPLYQDKADFEINRVRKTSRHQAVAGRRKETVDPREKLALIAILRLVILVLLLGLAFFMLWKGISIYEEKVWMDTQTVPETSPVMHNVALLPDFDISKQDGQETFSDRIEVWKKAYRLVGSVNDLLIRNNLDQAIERCQEVLKIDPANMKALEQLGTLYYDKKMYVEAVNTYIKLLSVDPSRGDLQLALLKSLDAYGDPDATISVAQWYQGQNPYNEDAQRYLANAYFHKESYTNAAAAYERVLKDDPDNVEALGNLSVSYMQLKQYDKALVSLNKLVTINFRDPTCYKRIAICYAQLGKGLETVQTLGKSAHLFGQNTVVGWIQDPRMDPIRMDRTFQSFADRVGGEEFRKYLEKMAQAMDQKKQDVTPQLTLPETQPLDSDLLKPKK